MKFNKSILFSRFLSLGYVALACLLIILNTLPQKALAQSACNSSNDEYQKCVERLLTGPAYEPDIGTCDISATPSQLRGSDNEQRAFNFFVDKGLKPFQSAAIFGNLMQESTMDPTSQQDGSKDPSPKDGVGFGIAQWTYAARQKPLVDLAAQEHKPVTDMGVQLDFLWQELNSTHSNALAALKASSDVVSATQAFEQTFEGAGTPAMEARIKYAQEALAKYGQGTPGGGGTGGGSTDNSGGCPAGSGPGGASGNKIVQIALNEVGTNEAGTDNRGPSCKYQGSACGQAWCADFVSWVYKQAGTPFTGGVDGGWRIAAAAGVADWFKNKSNGTWINNPGHPVPVTDPSAPKPGDVVYYPAGEGHVNIVVSYDGTTVKTVGGNQSDAVTTTDHHVFETAEGWGRMK